MLTDRRERGFELLQVIFAHLTSWKSGLIYAQLPTKLLEDVTAVTGERRVPPAHLTGSTARRLLLLRTAAFKVQKELGVSRYIHF